jgi:hypothetical protein
MCCCLPNISRDLCCLCGKPLRSGMPSRSPDMHGSMSHAHGLQFASLASHSNFEEIMGSVVICIFIGAFEDNPFFWRLPWWPHPPVNIIVYYMVRLRCLWCTYAGCEPPGIWLRKGVAIVQFADDPICGNPIGTSLTGIVVACPTYVDHPPILPACLQAPR